MEYSDGLLHTAEMVTVNNLEKEKKKKKDYVALDLGNFENKNLS